MANAAVTTTNKAVEEPKGQQQIKKWLTNEDVRRRFVDVLDKRADAFIASLVALVNESPELAKIDKPETVMTAALQAATLKLPINKNLGFAYIIPYKKSMKVGNKWEQVSQAQFQMGWKGYVQLAERTGQYETINSSVVYEGQVRDVDFITGKIVKGEKISDKVVGYCAYIEMKNGFNKTLYMTREEVEAHALKYSQSYAGDKNKGYRNSPWSTLFDAMAQKTVLKLLISKYGIMSIDTESTDLSAALAADSAVIGKDGRPDYIDNRTVDAVAYEVEANTGSQVFGSEEPPIDVQYTESKANTEPKVDTKASVDTKAPVNAEAPVTDGNALEGMSF